MPEENLTFEDVDKHIEASDLTALTAEGPAAEAVGNQVCAAYKVIRPILALLTGLPLIPKKWKDAIRIFMKFMDAFCPQN
jgi:hypothetical protein